MKLCSRGLGQHKKMWIDIQYYSAINLQGLFFGGSDDFFKEDRDVLGGPR